MATPAVPIEVRFGKLNTKGDPALLEPGELTLAENCSVQTDRIYRKRNGYSALAALPTTPPVRHAARGNELLALTRSLLYCYQGPTVDGWRSPLQQTSGSITSSRLPAAKVSQSVVYLDQATDITIGSRATSSTTGVTVHAYASSALVGGPLTIRCTDASGVFVATTTAVPGGVQQVIHCVAAGVYVLVLVTSTTGNLSYLRVDTSALTFGALTAYQTVSGAAAYFDAVAVSSTSCLIAWNSATPNVRVALFNIATLTTTAGPTVQSADVLDGGLSVASDGGTFGMVAYHSVAGGGVRGACFNATTTVNTVAAFTINGTVAPLAPNTGLVYSTAAAKMYCVWDRAAAGTTKQLVKAALVTSAGAVTAITGTLFNVGLASKPVVDPTAADTFFPLLLNVWAPHQLQQTYFTVRAHVTSATNMAVISPMAMHAYRGAYGSAIITGQLTDVDVYSSTAIAFSASIAYKFLSTNAARAGWSTFKVDLGSATMMCAVEALNSTYIAGGHGAVYDGTTIREMNFLLYPDVTVATPGAVGAGGMDNGTYSYIAIFEGSDANGNTDRSTTSVPISATTSAGAGLGKVTLTIDFGITRIGQASTVVPTGRVSVFRTANAGTSYFFISTTAMSALVAGVTVVDQANDSTIQGNRLLYTTGGVLDREPPLTANHMVLHRNAIWGISSADPKNLFYSGDISFGEAPWFSSAFQLRADVGGDIIAIASMDSGLVIFKEDRIFVVQGDRANQTGQGGSLTLPQLVNSDCGCVEPRSVIGIPAGVMFKSNKGIYLLTRGFEVQYVGAGVDQWATSYSNVNSAVMLTDRREVRFELSGPIAPLASPDGVTLVYNYESDQWTTHRKDAFTTAPVSAISVNGGYYVANATGTVYKETAAFVDPGNTYISMTLETGWLRLAGDQGLSRVQYALWLGQWKSDHALEMQIARNYVDVYTMDKVWDSATLAAIANEQVSMNLSQQMNEAVRIRVNDLSDSGVATPGEGMTARGIRLMAIAQRGSFEKFMSATSKG